MNKLNKKFIEEQKEALLEEKKKVEGRLSSFATESKEHEGEWASNMPDFDKGTSLEEEADEVEEFGMRLALEKSMEDQLKAIDLALEKIKKGTYGVCDKCGKEIPQGRLKAYPQASYCQRCQ
ncbi:MAG: TraR/DksA family transcriptional regulator [Candidatus Pacebacteria bacterium]|nr:TraR/DksA family transcriptional regulator [Candidatus Paceibacterota bacterium]